MSPGFPTRHLACRAAFLAAAIIAGHDASAQDAAPPADPAPSLDPAAPLAELPDLGVAWPDLPVAVAGDGRTDPDVRESRYDVVLTGLDAVGAADLRARFDPLSALVKGRGDPANAAQVDLRARDDAGVLRDLLRALGYYDAAVTPRVATQPGGRLRVTLAANPGGRYDFAAVTLRGIDHAPDAAALRAAFPVKAGDPVDADKVTAAETGLRTALGRRGYAFATVAPPEITVDHANRSAQLVLTVATLGAPERFGGIVLRGPERVFGTRHIQKIARFRPGERYDALLVDDLRRALIATSLVSVVEITPVRGSTPGVVDIDVRLEPAPPRTIAAQLGYGTGEGVRAELSWQHRNLIRPEGAVTFRGVAGTQEQSLGAELRRSNFHARDRVLTAQIAASHSERQAYDAKTFTVAAGIERQTNIVWQKKWTWSAGAQLLASDEKDVSIATGLPRRRTFVIAALPGTLAYDGSDDLLNPTRGFRLAGLLSPEVSFQDGSFGYARSQIDASAYLPLDKARVVLAGRLRFGSIFGAGRGRIAPSRRFYSGGGGSVRGYGYQDIGPRDPDNDPVGGRSVAEFAMEARIRFGDFGVVPFLDGGNLYTQVLPRFTGLRYGAGLGVRYYSAFGPIRVDVGTPLNPRHGDNKLAVYVSLGQAF